jgi:hypothetical protein
MEQENWINEILDSTNSLTSALPNAKLFSKIQNKIESQQKLAPQWVWLAAASIAILVAINITSIVSKDTSEETTEQIASSILKSNQLY